MPVSVLLRERRSRNLGENVRFTREMLAVRAIDTAMLVTKPNTMRRARATMARQWPQMKATVLAPETTLAEQAQRTIGWSDLICEMVGDVQRMLDYPGLGYQVDERVPAPVHDAFRALLERGYDRHLLRPALD